VETLRQDLRYAARTLAVKPGFTAIVIITLALGIGANTVIFSFANALLLTPMPYKDGDRLVRVMSQRGSETGMLSLLEVYDLKERAEGFEDFASIRNTQYNVTGDGPPQSLTACVNTWNLFDLLGVNPYLGNTWPPAHDRQHVFHIVLSYDVWQNRFGADREIVGKSILLDGAPYEVLGIMPPGFNFPLNAQLYRRVPPGDFDSRNIRESGVIARLKPGTTVEQAQAELDRIAQDLEQTYPDTNTGLRLKVSPFREHYIGNAGTYIWLLAGAVGFVLLIACVNVVNLMLARAMAREKEMAIRAAMGASRKRLIRQMLTESLLLTLVGGAVGVALSILCVNLMTGLIRLDLPAWMNIDIDARVLLFTLAISVITGLAAGLVPALQASRPDLNESLKDGTKGSSGGTGHRARRVLVIAQTALALVLLVGAGLMISSLLRLQQVALGFDSANMLTMKMDPPWFKYKLVSTSAQFYKRVIEEVERLPGVETAAFNDSLPLAGRDVHEGANRLNVQVDGQALDQQQRNPFVNAQIVSYGYFRAMKIPLFSGRFFDERDQEQTPPMAIISQRVAETLWPGRDPVGKRLKLTGRGQNYRPGDDEANDPWLTVAGVVANVRQRGVMSEPGLDVYLCDQQVLSPESYIAVRTMVDPMSLAESVKQAVQRVDPEQSVFDIQTMRQRVLNTIWQQRLSGVVLMLFAGLALLLASVGIYGVMSYLVTERTREIGIRMALGASSGNILRMILSQAMKLVLTGASLGIASAFLLTRVMASVLYEVSASDPMTFIAVPLILSAVALIACAIPARRAARVDPSIALRYE
jgi:putative ABC transport system permease protein